MKLFKKAACVALAASMLSIPVISHAEDYYNAIDEYNQIWTFIKNSMYLEAARDSQHTLDWHYLSPDDVDIFTHFRDEANYKYRLYLNGTYATSDVSWQIRQIRSYISRGLYIEAMNLCEQTRSKYTISREDTNTIQDLYNEAADKYQIYLRNYYTPDYIYNAKKALNVPANDDITYETSRPTFSPVVGQYIISVAFYQDGFVVASADVDPDTGKPLDKIIHYSNP